MAEKATFSPAERLAAKKTRKRPRRNEGKFGPHECAVRALRQSLDISINDVAAAAGISLAGLSAIERGFDVQLSTMKKLAKFYGRNLDELWPTT